MEPIDRFVMKNFTAIILAGGSGSRMKSATPKQLLKVLGRPLLYYSLYAFEKSPMTNAVLVTPPGAEEAYTAEFRDGFGFSKIAAVVPGGEERCDSVYNALRAIRGQGLPSDYVLIHDGARACVTSGIIRDMMEGAERYGAAIAAVPSKDTVKVADPEGFVGATPDRNIVWNIQTPQAFETELITGAFDKMYAAAEKYGGHPERITDDSMVVERYGNHKVKLIEASYTNMKVTTPEDIMLCEEILKKQGWIQAG